MQRPISQLVSTFVLALALATACAGRQTPPPSPPPQDPIAKVSADTLRNHGLQFARRGDLTRAQQYLSAALQKGYEDSIVVPELVKVCLADSQLRAALGHAEPYLERHPEDAGMSYVVGSIHLALGNLQAATTHLNGALLPEDAMIDAAFSLALVAEREGRYHDVRRHLRTYLAVAPEGRYSSRARHMLHALEEVAR